MRFACQSCGKAYNLPEEKIADKSNVKLKCRVCGAIVEVKRQGEVVAQMLAEVDGKRGRVSEAPAPLTSLSPDEGEEDDATQAIAVGDQILSESNSSPDAAASALLGHVKSALALGQRGLGPLPPPSPTGFGSASGSSAFNPPPVAFGGTSTPPFGSSPSAPGFGGTTSPPFGSSASAAGFGGTTSPPFGSSASAPGFGGTTTPPFGSNPSPAAFGGASSSPAFGGTPVPPPLAMPDAPPAFGRAEPVAPPLPSPVPNPPAFGSPPPPLPGEGSQYNGNGYSNGAVPRFGDVVPLPDEPGLPLPPVAMPSVPALGENTGFGVTAVELPRSGASDDTMRKMLAAFAMGILVGFIIARLFF